MKTIWQHSVAVITGGGSGIGRALAKAMAMRGAIVVITDINQDSAAAVARECGEKATSFQLDVRDAHAVKELIDTVYSTHSRLDFMFNNAGIGASGEAHEIPAALWDRIIDINIKGVINGVLAAYPIMVKQGSGHIINTASLAGLGASPLLAPYAMTKHAVVGLSSSLRIEAAAHGVNVNVLCPGAIETPILDSSTPSDLPTVAWMPDTRRFLTSLAGAPYPVDKFAEEALRSIEQNRAVIVIPGKARIAWKMGRFFPALVEKLSLKAVKTERSYRS
jgi:NAD(P)-dependent dehydrogenase (short-subunit alcohol dehydrogenase family)